jgi:hypothetical protein
MGRRDRNLGCTGCPDKGCLDVAYCQLVKQCTENTIINQITHGLQGQYSMLPMPSLWFVSARGNESVLELN